MFAIVLMALLWDSVFALPARIVLATCVLAVMGSIVYTAVALADGRKAIVLYLRRFRLTGAHRMMSAAIQAGLGRQYRIVTLDDRSFRPLEVPGAEKAFSWYGPVTIALSIPALVFAWVATITMGLAGLNPAAGVAMAAGFAVFAYRAFLILLWPASLVSVFLLVHRWRVRRRARMLVQTARDVRRCLIRVANLASRSRAPVFMAPQATVVDVQGELWQDLVARLGSRVDALVVDVSTITENLVWELKWLSSSALLSRCVFVGEKGRTDEWTGHGLVESGTATALARDLLESRSVLLYTTGGWLQKRRFRRSLLHALDNICGETRLPKRTEDEVAPNFGEHARAVLVGTLTYAIAAAITTGVYAGFLNLLARR